MTDQSVQFVPGPGVGLVGAAAVVLTEADPRSDLVAALGVLVDGAAPFSSFVDLFVDRFNSALPGMAVVHLSGDGEIRTLVRGAITLQLVDLDGNQTEWTAAEVSTWTERVERKASSVAIHLNGDLTDVGSYHVRTGVVPASRLVFDTSGGSRPPSADPFRARAVPQPDHPDVLPAPADEEAVIDVPPPVSEAELPIPPELPIPAELPVPPELPVLPVPASAMEALPDESPPDLPDPELASEDDDPSTIRYSSTIGFDAVVSDDTPDEAAPAIVGRAVLEDDAPSELADGETETDDLVVDDLASVGLIDGGPVVQDQESDDEFDHLFGATQFRPVSAAGVDDPQDDDAAMIASVPTGAPSASEIAVGDEASIDGDHDGLTVSLADLRAAGVIPQAGQPTVAPSSGSALVHAVRCPSEHLNPPSAVTCRVCGIEIPAQSHTSVPRPALGRLVFSTGAVFVLEGPALLGRSPKATGQIGGVLPELVALPSPAKEMSGTHLEVRLEGWQVVVVDRNSTNGTTVQLPRAEPQRLHPGDPFPIVPGTVVDLADEVQFTYEASV